MSERRPRLTRLELQLMDILWSLRSAAVREVQEAIPENKRPAYTTVQTILRAAATGEVGDGKVFVIPLQAVYRIRTGEMNEEAVTPEIAPSEPL